MVYDLKQKVRDVELAFALDFYKLEKGHTEIGELVHDIKYRGKYLSKIEKSNKQKKLANHFVKFIDSNIDEVMDFIIPVPSYNPKTPLNPSGEPKLMYSIACRISKIMDIPFNYSSVSKVVDKQAKDSFLKKGDFKSEKFIDESTGKNILLLDDLFGSGNSANLTIEAIKEKNPDVKIYFITATMNKFGGLGKQVAAKIDFDRKIGEKAESGKEYIRLNFMYNGFDEWVNIFENHKMYPIIKEMYNKKDDSEVRIKVKKGQNGYWMIVEEKG